MYITRVNQQTIFHSFEKPHISALLGSRRVGKSTLTQHYANQYPERSWVFLNMDHMEQRLRVEKGELRQLIQESLHRTLDSAENKIWVLIDEVQKCPALFEQIKTLYDEYKDKNKIKFILTGSGFLELHRLSAESLAGRIEIYYLREFTLKEAISTKTQIQSEIDKSTLFDYAFDNWNFKELQTAVNLRTPLQKVAEYVLKESLIWGGLPEVLELGENNQDRKLYLGNYLQTYLERDVRSISTITDLHLYQKLLEIIAEQTGSVRQDKKITDALGCTRDTLKKYRGFLLSTLVYKEIFPFINNSIKRIVKSPKGYLLNNGLISYLTGLIDLTLLEKTGIIGHRFENWLLNELQVWLDRDSSRHEIYYWRTSANNEVDFVVQRKPDIFPIEVTFSTQIQKRKMNNLRMFLKNTPQAPRGYYVYMGPLAYNPEERICFLPAYLLI